MKKFILLLPVIYVLTSSCDDSLLEKDILKDYILDSLIVSPESVQLYPESTYRLNVKGRYIKQEITVISNEGVLGSISDTIVEVKDTRIMDMDPTDVEWYSEDTFICTVSDYGYLEGNHTGFTRVWCEKEGLKSNFVSVNVIP